MNDLRFKAYINKVGGGIKTENYIEQEPRTKSYYIQYHLKRRLMVLVGIVLLQMILNGSSICFPLKHSEFGIDVHKVDLLKRKINNVQ